MKVFFEPDKVAFIGATATHGKPGRSLHKNLIASFGERYFPVNPRGGEYDGQKVYQSISEIPEQVDLAIIFIPSERVPGAVEECVRAGVRGVIIQSSGFAEVGPKGKELQDKIVDIAHSNGVRVWGPNCMGSINARKKYVMSFMISNMWEGKLVPGDISLVVQSGMLSAGFLMAVLGRAKFGLSKVCSIGNKADVDELDVLEYLIDDPETGVIAMYLESINDGHRFLKAARSTDKPLVVLKGGYTEGGAKAAVSHTASIAGNKLVIDGALKQAEVVRVDGFHELLDTARVISQFGRRAADPAKIAVLTFSGAAGIVSSDIIESMGMKLAEFSPETVARLQKVYPTWMPPENPGDLYPALEINGPTKTYEEAIKAVLDDPGVDGVLIHIFALATPLILKAIDNRLDDLKKKNKPIVTWLMGDPEVVMDAGREIEKRGIPVMPDIQRSVKTLAAVFSGKK